MMGGGRASLGAALAAVAWLTACANEAPRPNPNGDDPDGGPRAEAGIRDVGAPDAELEGTIYAFARRYQTDAGMIESYAVTAGFAETPSEVCTDRTPPFAADFCVAQRCVPRTPEPGDGGPRPTASNIQLNGGRDQVYLFLAAAGVYQVWTVNGWLLFQGGEQLTVTADGAEVPAFTGSLTAPARPILLAPAVPAPGGVLELARDRDLLFSWRDAPRGKLRVSISVFNLEERNIVECIFAADTQSGNIPRDVLSTLPSGDGFYELRLEETAELTAGEYKVRFTAATNVIDETRAWAHGPLGVR